MLSNGGEGEKTTENTGKMTFSAFPVMCSNANL